MIPVYDGNGDVVARVAENTNLDYWDGSNWTNGGTGLHKGLTRLKDGRYVLIHGTQWQGDRDRAEVITPEQAAAEIAKSGNTELYEDRRFKGLKSLLIEEDTGDE